MKNIYDSIFRLYLYSDNCKIIHYTTDKMHGHKLADEIRDDIINFTDAFAEQFFGHYGKPNISQLTIKQNIKEEDNLELICQDVLDIVEPLRTKFKNNDKVSNLVSLIDDFKGKIKQHKFFATFDHLS